MSKDPVSEAVVDENVSPEIVTEVRQFTIGYDDDGIRLDRWFKRHQPEVSFNVVSRWTRLGQLRIDGRKATPGDRLQAGQVLRVPPPEPVKEEEAGVKAAKPRVIGERPVLTPEQIAYAESFVIHRDKSAIVINKPPGLATQGGTKTTEHVDGLLDALQYEADSRPKLAGLPGHPLPWITSRRREHPPGCAQRGWY